MNKGQLGGILRYLERLTDAGRVGERSDAHLLECFVARRDEAAFAALLRRHGPLVWGVCRRALRNAQDAEDAFQATFLILVRSAGSIGKRESVRSWLYGVASRVSIRARQTTAVRHAREALLEGDLAVAPAPVETHVEVRPILDEEIGRLPEKYRLPLILCHLEGLSQEQAAQLLGCPRATVATRLARGRARLRSRLAHRGVESLPSALGHEAALPTVPITLMEATLRAVSQGKAATVVTGSVRATFLAEEVLRAMLLTKWKMIAVVLLVCGVVGPGVGVLASRPQVTAPTSPQPGAVKAQEPVAQQQKQPEPPVSRPIPEEPAPQVKGERGTKYFADRLAQLIQFKGFEADPKMTLDDALNYLADRYDLTFVINEAAFKADISEAVFKAEKINSVLEKCIAAQPLPAMPGASLESVLRRILSRIPARSGATFLIRPDFIEFTTQAAALKELGRSESCPLWPLVTVSFEKLSLDEALQGLATRTGFSIVVDVRAAEQKQTLVTANLANVPLDTAVLLLADMADLKPVLLDNVFYVTTPENAAKLRAEQEQRPPRAVPAKEQPAPPRKPASK
jgi:RNA polymerase sigma factor (sigma-70 family)